MKTFVEFVTEAVKSKLPPVPPGHLRLVRGDSSKIDAYDTAKTADTSLFGRGIYLTNNTRIANDYKVKGGTDDVLMTFGGLRTKDAVKERYINRVARYTDATGKEDPYGREVPFSDGQSWSMNSNGPRERVERPQRLAHATKKWDALMKTHEVRFKVGGDATIQKKAQLSSTGFAVFDVPQSYVAVIQAEQPIVTDVFHAIVGALSRAGDRGTAADLQRFYKEQDREGDPPTYRDIYTNITAESPFRYDDRTITKYIESLQDLGYTGIEYAGGVTLGGGTKHRAFVFWDSEKLNTFRIV